MAFAIIVRMRSSVQSLSHWSDIEIVEGKAADVSFTHLSGFDIMRT